MSELIATPKDSISDSVILIVDDDPINSAVVEALLKDLYITHVVHSGEEALDFCTHTFPDLILLDVMMGGISGLETCRLLKKNPHTENIPVVFITSIMDQDGEISCWEAGCVDFVSKPVNGVTLLNRIKSHLTLKLQSDLLRSLTFIDGLTGLYNRHLLDELIGKGILHTNRTGQPLTLMMIDVDWFKLYNDTYGHLQGDECLKSIAQTIKQSLHRPTDVAIRFGGEEFLCFLPDTDHQGAIHLAEQLKDAVENLKIEHNRSNFNHVTISIGLHTVHPETPASQKDVINQADKALYNAKKLGRNQVYFESSQQLTKRLV